MAFAVCNQAFALLSGNVLFSGQFWRFYCPRLSEGTTAMTDGEQPRVVLLGRPECHLCDDAREVVAAVCGELHVSWGERDLSESPDELARWWDKIPVTLVDGAVHNFWRVDPERLRTALATTGP